MKEESEFKVRDYVFVPDIRSMLNGERKEIQRSQNPSGFLFCIFQRLYPIRFCGMIKDKVFFQKEKNLRFLFG